jgi:hypothetical protein
MYRQQQTAFIADRLAPNLGLPNKTDIYYTYSQADFMRDEVKERAAGTESQGTEYGLSSSDYKCQRWALHKDLTDEDVKIADSMLDLHQDATQILMDKMLLKRETNLISTVFKTGVWTGALAGTDITAAAHGNESWTSSSQVVCLWSDKTNSTPVTDIVNACYDQAEITGQMPNTLVLGPRTFLALKNHPDIKQQYMYTSPDSITTEMLARVLEIDTVLVPTAISNTYKRKVAGTKSMSYLWGKDALLCYVAPRVALKTATSMLTITWNNAPGAAAGGQAISTIPIPEKKVERVEIEAFWTQKVIGAPMGAYFSSVVS